MRITSDLFAAQLVRRLFSDGSFAAIIRKGAEAAGAIFIVARDREGTATLYGPAPQSFADETHDRRFIRECAADETAIAARLEREARFDPDFWVVEIETAEPERYLELVG